ncbi:MAG: hypothetical protein AB1529_06505 [Candidatus Micrarchaeota archaeon]
MTSQKSVVCLLLLLGVLYSFNVTDYLYPEESNASISYTNFTLNGTAYSIVNIGGQDAFLLRNGAPVSNRTEIDSLLYSYYIRTYYPSQDELDELSSLIKQFNDSRNDGYDFKGKEEYVCRDDVLLSNGKITVSGQPVRCTDNESCTRNAMLLFSVYGQGLNLGSPTVLFQPLYDFTPSSLKMDALLANYSTRLDNLNESNLVETLTYISDTSGELETLSDKIESTIFRTPRLNDTEDRAACQYKCWAICPSFDLDQGAAEDLQGLAEDLVDKIGPLSGYQGMSSEIYNQTLARLEHVKSENMETYYSDVFRPLNSSASSAIGTAEEALTHVQNKTLSGRLDDLKSLHTTIPEDITGHNFTNLDLDIGQYQNLTAQVNEGAGFLLSEYNQTVEAKNGANALILVLQSKDLDPVSLKSLELLQNKSSDLDAQFRDGLTLAQLQALEANYSDIADEAEELLQSESETPSTRVLLLFRGFARRVNTGIAHVAEKTDIVPAAEIPDSPLNLGLFSLLVFLSFSSMALLLFLYVFATGKFTIPKTTHILGAAFLSLVMLIFVFSALMYLFLGKTSTDATLPEFLSDFDSKNNTSILVDLRNASFEDAQAMRSCASTLAGSFGERNKTWTMLMLTPTTCTLTSSGGANTSLAASDCQTAADEADSSFVLGYSERNAPPRFSVIYQNRAEIRANLDYYESCPLVALFS